MVPSANHLLSFSEYPELLCDIKMPKFVEDSLQQLPIAARPPLRWIFIGPAGSRTRTHVDPCLVSAWLIQVVGRKRFLFLPPHLVPLILTPSDGFMDFTNQDGSLSKDLPADVASSIVEVVLKPGDMVYIPEGWAHEVIKTQIGRVSFRERVHAIHPIFPREYPVKCTRRSNISFFEQRKRNLM